MFNFISKIFGREPPKETKLQTINLPAAQFSAWTGNAYANDLYRAGVDAIARNAGKLKGVHVVTSGGQRTPADDRRINYLLQISPNPYMTAYDLLYKLVTQYFLYNNAFAVLDWNEQGKLAGIFPINYTNAQMLMDASGKLYVAFIFRNGKKAQFEYSDLIHIRRHFNSNEFLGDDNRALDTALEMAHTQNEGIISAIKNGGALRGLLKLVQTTKAKDAQQIRENFVKDYLSVSNNGGLAILDSTADYIPLNNPAPQLDNGQLQATKDKIYNYLGISEKIVNSSYSEDEYSAFYESVIEPVAVQLSLEFTRKIFSSREQAFGNQIIFESGRLQFSSNETKINLLKELLPLGLLTINQGLEVLNIAPIEGGDKRLQTLNVVDANVATEYQMARAGKGNENRNPRGINEDNGQAADS